MYCKKCGTQNPDTNTLCSNCGAPLIQPEPPVVPQPPQYGQAPQYGQPPVYGAAAALPPGYPRRSSSSAAFWLALLFSLLSFISLCTPWMHVDLKAGSSYEKNPSFFDYFKEDSSKDVIYSSVSRISSRYSKKVKRIKACRNIMKWAGLAGFVHILLTLEFSGALKKHILVPNIMALICFLAVLIAGFIEASTFKSLYKDAARGTSSISVFPSVGVYLPVVFMLAAVICSALYALSGRRTQPMYR